MKKKKEKIFPTKGNKIIVYKINNPIAEDEILEQFVFTDDGTFDKMLDSELFRQIREKCDAYFLDRGEEQILEGTQIDTAIELIEKNIDKPRYQQCKFYLEKIIECLRLAKEHNSYVEFIVAV